MLFSRYTRRKLKDECVTKDSRKGVAMAVGNEVRTVLMDGILVRHTIWPQVNTTTIECGQFGLIT
jgi:hypothetical protein